MKNRKKRFLAVLSFSFLCLFAAGCGCGKEKDEKEEKVMTITITPEPSPTPAPEEVNPDAVVEKVSGSFAFLLSLSFRRRVWLRKGEGRKRGKSYDNYYNARAQSYACTGGSES